MSRRPKLVLIPGPLTVYTAGTITEAIATTDQGSVLPVRVFGSLSIYFTPQIETISNIILDYPIVKC